MSAILSKRFLGRSVSVMALGAVLALPTLTGAMAHNHDKEGAGKPAHAAAMFERLDANKDGFIDADELKAAREKHFERMDTNKDGFIDEAELKEQREKMHESMKEHRIKRAENHVKRTEELFDKLDTNKDGSISREEYAAHVEKAKERAEKMRERIEKNEGKEGKRHGKKGGLMHLDKDKDGKISKAEFMDKKDRMLKLDTDKDGKISKDEFEAGAKKFHKGPKGEKGDKKAE